MSLSAVLQFGGNSNNGIVEKEFGVAKCYYKLSNFTTKDGGIRLFGATIEVFIPVTDAVAGDMSLYEWYLDGSQKDGSIVVDFSMSTNETDKRKIEFSNARCSSISEEFDIHKDLLRMWKVSIYAPDVKILGTDLHRA